MPSAAQHQRHGFYGCGCARPLMAAAILLSFLIPSGRSVAASFNQFSDTPSTRKQPTGPVDPSLVLTGYFSARYTFRTAETPSMDIARDQDAYAELRVDATTPKSGRYEFHFMGSARNDLDGNRDINANYLLEDIGDTGDKHTTGYVYEAHFDINNPVKRMTQLRLGRQAGTRDEQVTFDGIAADLRPASSMNLTLYGGAAVNYFEINRTSTGDTVAGAGVDLYPTASTGISVDYASLKDERDYLQMTTVQNRLLSLKVWQRFTPSLKATAKLRYQDGETRDLNLRILGIFPGVGTEVGAGYLRQFSVQPVQANALSPFVDVVGQSNPYQSYEVKLRQFFGKRYAADLAYFKRDLTGSEPPGTYNREYSRTAAGFEISDLLTANLSLTLTGDQWKSDEQSFSAAGADVGYSFGRKGSMAKVNAGTYYSLYKYDYTFQPGERTDVRTYYLNARLPLARQVALNINYEFERSIEKYQNIKAGIRYDF